MYVSLRSPKGGHPLASLWASIRSEKNIQLDPDKKPEVQGDYVVFKLGYATKDIKAGEILYFKRSEVKKLKPIVFNDLID